MYIQDSPLDGVCIDIIKKFNAIILNGFKIKKSRKKPLFGYPVKFIRCCLRHFSFPPSNYDGL